MQREFCYIFLLHLEPHQSQINEVLIFVLIMALLARESDIGPMSMSTLFIRTLAPKDICADYTGTSYHVPW